MNFEQLLCYFMLDFISINQNIREGEKEGENDQCGHLVTQNHSNTPSSIPLLHSGHKEHCTNLPGYTRELLSCAFFRKIILRWGHRSIVPAELHRVIANTVTTDGILESRPRQRPHSFDSRFLDCVCLSKGYRTTAC